MTHLPPQKNTFPHFCKLNLIQFILSQSFNKEKKMCSFGAYFYLENFHYFNQLNNLQEPLTERGYSRTTFTLSFNILLGC